MLIRAGAAGLLVVAALIGGATPAMADPVEVEPSAEGGDGGGTEVIVEAEHPGNGGGVDLANDNTRRRAGERECSFLGSAVPCANSDHGTWWSPGSCWIRRVSPQPPKDEPMWDGHTDGVLYWCEQPEGTGQTIGHYVWLPDGAAGGVDVVDPVELAEQAIARMHLVAPTVGATPSNGGTGIVGLQTWLWVANDGPTSMGPVARTATAGPVSVTATAAVTKVQWDMGNGDRVACRTAGTRWKPGDGGGKSPTCGYTYLLDSGDQPGDAYTIEPTAHWRVEWSGAGQSGVITFTLDGPELAMPIVELQAPRVDR